MMSDGSVLAPSIARLRDKLAGQANRMIDLFRKWDRNHDSVITKDEFSIMLPELGLDVRRIVCPLPWATRGA